MIDAVTGFTIPKENKLSQTGVYNIEDANKPSIIEKDVEADMDIFYNSIVDFRKRLNEIFESKEIKDYFNPKLNALFEDFQKDYEVKTYQLGTMFAYSYARKEKKND